MQIKFESSELLESFLLGAEAEEGFEIAFFMEDPGGGGDEGEEEEDHDDLFTDRTRSSDGDRGILERGEGRSGFLHPHLSLLDLTDQLLIDRTLKLHIIFQLGPLLAGCLQEDLLIAVSIANKGVTGLLVTLLGFCEHFLIMFQVNTNLTGAIVGDGLLKSHLHRVGHRGTDHGILVGHLDADDHGLLVNITDDLLF